MMRPEDTIEHCWETARKLLNDDTFKDQVTYIKLAFQVHATENITD